MSRGKAVKVKVHESVESNTNRKKHSPSRLKCSKSSTANLSQTPQIPTRRELEVSHDEEEPITPSKKDEEQSREQKIKEVGEDKGYDCHPHKQDQINDKQQQINELKDSLNTDKVASQREINGLKI